MPIAWRELWGRVAGRFPRPHLARAENAADSTAPEHSSGAADISRNVNPTAEPILPLPLHNNVTGLNYTPAARQHANTQH
eukprot:4275365-Pleurochrysis_carterae.AAC.1